MKRIYKILISIFIIPFLFFITVLIIFHSSKMQTYITHKISNYYSEELKTDISIKNVDFDFFDIFVMKNILLSDQHSDSLLYIPKLKAEIDSFDISENKFFIKKISLIEPVVKINFDTSGNSNFDFIIDYFSGNDNDKNISPKSESHVFCKNFEFKNTKLKYKVDNNNLHFRNKTLFDENNIEFNSLNLNIKNINLQNHFTFQLQNLSFNEKCGLNLKELSCSARIENAKITISKINIIINNSNINLEKIIFSYKNFDDFNTEIKLNSAKIYLSDFAYFNKNFQNTNNIFLISGNLKKQSDNLKIKDLKIETGKNTVFKSDIRIENINDFDFMKFYVDTFLLKTNKKDFYNFPMKQTIGYKIKIPEEISGLNEIDLAGKIFGSQNNIEFKGIMKSNTGTVKTEVNYQNKKQKLKKIISAKFRTDNFNVKKLTKIKYLKYMSFNTKIDIIIQTNNPENFKIKTFIRKIDFNEYTYKNIEINTELKNNIFKTDFSVNDNNLNLISSLRYDFSEKLPVSLFYCDINFANFDKLGIDTISKSPIISGMFAGEITGNNIDNITGFAGITNAKYKTKKDTILLTSMILTSENTYNQRIINIQSDYFDADIRGTFKINTLNHAFKKFISEYIPAYSENWDTTLLNEDKLRIINLTVDFKNLEKINDFFFPNIHISDASHLEAFFRTNDAKLDLYAHIPEIKINNDKIRNFKLHTFTQDKLLNININTEFILTEEDLWFERIFYRGTANNNSLNSILSWHNSDSIVFGGDFAATTIFKSDNEKIIIDTEIQPTEQTIAGTVWKVDGSTVKYDGEKIFVNGINFTNKNQNINISGKISKNPNEFLNIDIQGFDLNKINYFTDIEEFKFSGIFNGNIIFYNLMQTPYFEAISYVNNFEINKKSFGDMSLSVEKDTTNNLMNIETFAQNGKNRFRIQGQINESNEIEINAAINTIDMKIMNKLFDEYMSIKSGNANGYVQLFGNFDKLKWSGIMNIKDTEIEMKYLGAKFKISSIAAFDNNIIEIAKSDIFDNEGNKAVCSAVIKHENFDNFDLDINFSTDKFLAMNNNPMCEEDYYGKLYTSGLVNIKGNPDNLKVDAAMTTLPGSEISVLASNGEILENSDFIIYTSDSIIDEKNVILNQNFSDIILDINMKITPETKLKLIIDTETGDAISMQGESKLNIKTDVGGNMDITGDYIIHRGDYKLNINELYSLLFKVKPQSKITWNGSPEDANINITAGYSIRRVKLYNLLLEEYAKNIYVPVDCNIFLTNKLLSPKIKFGVDVKENLDMSVNSLIQNLSEDNINKQFLSLLVLSAFQPLPGITKVENTMNSDMLNPTEIFAGQLSSLLSSISKNVDIDVKYHPHKDDEYEDEDEDDDNDGIEIDGIEIDFSTSILDERIIINGNLAKSEYENSTDEFVGDFEAEIKITPDGKIKMKIYNKSNRNSSQKIENYNYTQGVGFFFRKDFDNFDKFFNKIKFWKK